MKSFLTWVVVLGAFFGVGYYGYNLNQEASAQAAYNAKLAEIKREFLVAGTALPLLDDEQYTKEIGIYLTRYHKKVEDLGKDFPERYDAERKIKEADARVAAGTLTPVKADMVKERVNIVLDLYNKMRAGQYRPLYSKADKTFRFDIYEAGVVDENDVKRIRIKFAHFGAFAPLNYRGILGNIREPQEARDLVKNRKAGREARQITSDGGPILDLNPEKWLTEFLPGVKVGYYDLPLLPQKATALGLSFDYGMRTVSGIELPVSINFGDIPVDDSWKLAEGEVWNAQEKMVVDESEMTAAVGDAAAE